MTLPDEKEIVSSARLIVMHAKGNNTLEQLSKNKVRKALESEFGLEEGALKDLKSVISRVVDESIEAETESEAEETPQLSTSKRKRVANDDHVPVSPIHNKRKNLRTIKPPSSSPSEPSNDEDGVQKSDSGYGEAVHGIPSRANQKSRKAVGEKSEKIEKLKPGREDATSKGHESESELSEVIDEPPPKRSRKKGGDKERTRKPKEPPSKSEEIIKKYKAMVLACGVRKQWKKVFADCPTETAQIKRLKSILTDLGMKGRMSMDQARAIRQKRELKAEIEDVIKFERGVNPRQSGSSKDSDEVSSDNSERNMTKPSTSRSIMAFLADQSDSD